jgi:3'-5' exoribonuclease
MNIVTALVLDAEQKQGKKAPYWHVDLKSTDGPFRAMIWDVPEPNNPELPRKGDILNIDFDHKGVKDQRDSKFGTVIFELGSFKKVAKEDLPKEVLDVVYRVAKASEKQLERAHKTIVEKSMYKNVDNFLFVMACLANFPREKLFTCPAGKSVHHSYQGGLIVHTSEVVQICRGIVAAFPFPQFINQDVIFAGATLHDIGKVVTYGNDELGQPMHVVQETSIGHIYYGMSLVEKIGKERNVDPAYLDEVLHVIASHHTKPEFGAIKEPATLEAMVVSAADYLGSRAGVIESKLSPMKKNNTPIEEEWKSFGQRYVVGSAIKRWFNAD